MKVQNIIENKLCQISVMSQLNTVVNTVGANLISNSISLAFAKLIFANIKHLVHSPRRLTV